MDFGYATITSQKEGRQRILCIKSGSDFLNERVIVESDDSFISIKRPPFDYQGKTYSVGRIRGGYYSLSIMYNDEIPTGRYHFDQEDSNEDELIMYFNQE